MRRPARSGISRTVRSILCPDLSAFGGRRRVRDPGAAPTSEEVEAASAEEIAPAPAATVDVPRLMKADATNVPAEPWGGERIRGQRPPAPAAFGGLPVRHDPGRIRRPPPRASRRTARSGRRPSVASSARPSPAPTRPRPSRPVRRAPSRRPGRSIRTYPAAPAGRISRSSRRTRRFPGGRRPRAPARSDRGVPCVFAPIGRSRCRSRAVQAARRSRGVARQDAIIEPEPADGKRRRLSSDDVLEEGDLEGRRPPRADEGVEDPNEGLHSGRILAQDVPMIGEARAASRTRTHRLEFMPAGLDRPGDAEEHASRVGGEHVFQALKKGSGPRRSKASPAGRRAASPPRGGSGRFGRTSPGFAVLLQLAMQVERDPEGGPAVRPGPLDVVGRRGRAARRGFGEQADPTRASSATAVSTSRARNRTRSASGEGRSGMLVTARWQASRIRGSAGSMYRARSARTAEATAFS